MLISIENVIGTNFFDVLTGDGGANVLNGNGGDDILIGGGGGARGAAARVRRLPPARASSAPPGHAMMSVPAVTLAAHLPPRILEQASRQEAEARARVSSASGK